MTFAHQQDHRNIKITTTSLFAKRRKAKPKWTSCMGEIGKGAPDPHDVKIDNWNCH